MAKNSKSTHAKALQVLTRLQKALLRRLADYVLENEATLRQAADGAEGYGFSLHQLDELFLSRLNLVERAIAELQKSPAKGSSRYRTLCFAARPDELEQKVNSRLEKMPEARILGISVLPSWQAASARGGGGGMRAPARREAQTRSRRTTGSPDADARSPEPPELDMRRGGAAPLLVTVLYYGPEPEGE
jgi:hypothetical protein